MPFIPHTEAEVKEMLERIGVGSVDALFDEIPPALRHCDLSAIPTGMDEAAITRLMQARAKADESGLCFIGAGAYEHHIPAAVWDIAGRGEFLTAYTPYQAEASQGTLQTLYEYQTMMARLMAMDVSNASLYDGASALAEAILMAVRVHRKSKARRVLLPNNVHPAYRKTVATIVAPQAIERVEVPYCTQGGNVVPASLQRFNGEPIAALVIAQPNFFGVLEEVDALTDWAHAQGALVIAVVNPIAMALLKPPGEWGTAGADIVCGEGQPLGAPLASGGPYFGILCCKQAHVRQMPGRLVGRTVDVDGKEGFTLTLQAREQHIRRAKAMSNICTNQGLLVTAATVTMALLGADGLRRIAIRCHAQTAALVERLTAIPGVERVFDRPFFHEAALRLKPPTSTVLDGLAEAGIQGGYDLAADYPELGNGLLVCATETKTNEDLDRYAETLRTLMQGTPGTPPC